MLPYPERTFDRVLSSLVMSVLDSEQKRLAIREAHRVLKQRGEIHIVDFGPPHTRWGRWVAPKVRRFEPVAGNLDGVLTVLHREAGFEQVTEGERFATLFGTIMILSGIKP
jgi:SAM-dependent methyltransferase